MLSFFNLLCLFPTSPPFHLQYGLLVLTVLGCYVVFETLTSMFVGV